MIMGIYDTYLQAISSINLLVLLPMGFGLVIGGFIILKLIQYFMKEYYSETYYCIIGFVIGSIFILIPELSFDLEGLTCVGTFLSGLLIGFIFEKFDS